MLILLLCGVIFAWYLQFIIYRKYWDKGLDISVRFEDAYVYEGDTSYLREEIANDKALPLPALEVRLALDRSFVFSGEAGKNASVSDKNYQRDVFAFFGRQKVIRRLPFQCRKRGYYEITQSEIVGYDLLYLNEYYQERSQRTQMYVYPAPVDVSRIRLICQTISGMVLAQRKLYPDPFEFSGIREYQMTDPMNHINWKASARNGSLMVNQFDSTTSISATLLLDVEDSGILRYEKLVEESIRIAASLAAELVGKGMELEMISNAYSNMEGLHMYIKSGAGLLQRMYQKLACVDTEQQSEPLGELIEQEQFQNPSGHIYVIISKNIRENIDTVLSHLTGSMSQVLWVVPFHPYQEEDVFADGYGTDRNGIRFIRWEVE